MLCSNLISSTFVGISKTNLTKQEFKTAANPASETKCKREVHMALSNHFLKQCHKKM